MKNILSKERQVIRTLVGSSNFNTKHLVVCFDSDDWGVPRCSSLSQIYEIREKGIDMSNEGFVQKDSIEREENVIDLANLLTSFTDSYGNHPSFTLNFSMFSPDYERIKKDDYRNYFYHSFVDNYQNKKKMIFLFKHYDGICFDCQLHGAEHVNVLRFLSDCRLDKGFAKLACDNSLTAVGNSYTKDNRFGYMDEMDYFYKNDVDFALSRLMIAKQAFEEMFNKSIHSLAPSCDVVPRDFSGRLFSIGFVVAKVSAHVFLASKNYDLDRRLVFFKKRQGLSYIVRNCDFEPALSCCAFDRAVSAIDLCAKLHKPCIICTHRVNFASSLFPAENQKNRELLRKLIVYILSSYPDVEFLSTNDCFEKYGKK